MLVLLSSIVMLQSYGQTTVNGVFSGADAANNLFSNPNNWTAFPTWSGTGSKPTLQVNGTTSANPAQLDAAFNALLPSGFGVNVMVAPGVAGTAYMEVLDGAELRATQININWGTGQPSRNGQLTLKSGSVLTPDLVNNGALGIGQSGGGTGKLIVENNVDFKFSNLILGPNGTLTYVFGTNSVSTFNSTKSNGAATMTLDGVIQLDLTALTQAGTYTLITSSDVDTTMSGAFATWLTGEGGQFSGHGSYDGVNFEVLSGGNVDWTLSSADGGSTLNFTVIPEPATAGLSVISAMGLCLFRYTVR